MKDLISRAALTIALCGLLGVKVNPAHADDTNSYQAKFSQNCPEHFPGIVPTLTYNAGPVFALCYDDFAIFYSGHTKTPLYTVTKLNRQRMAAARAIDRQSDFFDDARVPERYRSKMAYYKGSGLDRGHILPNADAFSPAGEAQCMSMLNIAPQYPNHNRKVWSGIEESTRKYIERRAKGDVYVFTGVVFRQEKGALKGGVKIPSHFYKLVVDMQDQRAWALVSEHDETGSIIAKVSEDELQSLSGIDFLPN